MAKPPIPVHSVKAEVLGFYGPATWANVLYFDINPAGPPVPTDVFILVQDVLHQLYAVQLAPHLVPDWRVTSYKIGYRDSPTSMSRVTVADAIAGSATSGAEQTAQVCYLINWVSGDPRKGGKPRTYLPGVEDSALLNSAQLNPTSQANLTTAIEAWLAYLATDSHGTATGISFVEMSFFDGKAPRSPDAVSFPILSGYCNSVVATQRRRADRLRP